jgi:8-oxo-dGTP diphosphatase
MDISVDCVVFGFYNDKLNVLLIEQKNASINQEKRFALPGDLVFDNEDLGDAAKRVLFELTGLSNIYLQQFFAFGNPNRVNDLKDREWLRSFRKHPERRVLTIGYFSLVKMCNYTTTPNSFAQSAEWVDVNKIPPLAFDHNEIYNKAFETLKLEIEHNHLAFELLPDKFTLNQLQNLYEIVLGVKLDKRNFRRSISKIKRIIPLNEKQEGVLHKPARFYTFSNINLN